MIKLRRRNPVTEMARLGSLAGSKLTRTRGSRKEWFAGAALSLIHASCMCFSAPQWGWAPGAGPNTGGVGEVLSLADKISTRIESRLAQPRATRSGHSPRRFAYLSPEALRAL
jgi:hypothetical protein